MEARKVINIGDPYLRVQAWDDEAGISIVVSCSAQGGGLITVPARLRTKLAVSLEELAQALRQWGTEP